MARKGRGVGAVVGRSDDHQAESMRDQIVDGEGPGLDLRLDAAEHERKEAPKVTRTKVARSKDGKKLRNHEIDIDYFRALDEILARSYVKQEAAHNIVEAFTRMMESRGIEAPFEDERFERAAGNMAVVGMMREMAWAFGLGADLADRIAEHTVDKLFSPGQAKGPEVRKS